MKKRIFAIFTAVLLVLSAVLMTACDKTDDDNGGEESKVDVESLSAKELFAYSFSNAVPIVQTESVELGEPSDIKESIAIEINKLSVSGEDMTAGSPIKAEMDIALDADNSAAEVDLALELFGEKPTASAAIIDKTIYVTDILGVNEKPIYVTFEDLGLTEETLNSALNEAGITMEQLKDIAGLGNFVIETVTGAIEANITDDAYSIETKDVVVDGTEIKGAKVVTLTITTDMAKNIVNNVLTKLLENETVKALLGEDADINVDDVISELDSFGGIKIVNTVDYDKSVALDIDITASAIGGNSAEAEVNQEQAAVSTSSEVSTFAVRSTFVGNSFKLGMGLLDGNGALDAEQGIFNIVYTLDDAGNENISASFTEGEETVNFVTVTGTYKNGKRDATLTTYIDGDEISVKFSTEGTIANGKFTITEIAMLSQGVTVSIPMELSVSFTNSAKKSSTGIVLKLSLEDTIDIDMKMSVEAEFTAVNITAPSNAISYTEISEDDAMEWMTDIQTKYPTIFSMIESMSGSAEPDYDYNYDYDYGYEDEYDYGFGTGTVIP